MNLWVYSVAMNRCFRSAFSSEEDIQAAAELNPHFIYFYTEAVSP